jgi:outer membrane receptor protein involved in Fe transport
VDLQLSYETPADTLSWLGNMQIALNAQNLFNVSAPFLNNPLGEGYDPENADLLGRIVSLEIRKRW